jgi:hypothetical protein
MDVSPRLVPELVTMYVPLIGTQRERILTVGINIQEG